ncbi:restriction endonuclease subunit S [Actinomycetota bacterium]
MNINNVTFGDLYKYPSRNGIYKEEKYHGSGWKIVNMGELFKYDFISKQEMNRVQLTNTEMRAFKLEDGDLLFGRRSLIEDGAGKCSIVINPTESTTFESSIIRVRIDKEKVNPQFLFYYFKSYYGRGRVRAIVSGVNVKGIRGSDLKKIKLSLPYSDTGKQAHVVSFLSSYDNLLDANRRRVQLLEESARLLFREWFVYFKFPNHEKVKIVDGAPEGWKKVVLNNIANRIKKNYSMVDEDLNLIDLSRMNSRTLSVSDVGTSSDLETARIIFEKDDVLFSSIRPYLHKVVLAPFKGITNTSVFVVRAKNPIFRAYITLLLFSDYAIQFANVHSTGTKMPVVKWGSVSKLLVLMPPQKIIEDFQNIVWPMLEQIQLIYFQNQKLIYARDLLIPRLMSGAIEV